MLKYLGTCLVRGSRQILVRKYLPPTLESHKTPCGTRHGHYECLDGDKVRYILTPNISRYMHMGYHIEGEWTHAGHSIRHQENVSTKLFGMWHKFTKLFSGNQKN